MTSSENTKKYLLCAVTKYSVVINNWCVKESMLGIFEFVKKERFLDCFPKNVIKGLKPNHKKIAFKRMRMMDDEDSWSNLHHSPQHLNKDSCLDSSRPHGWPASHQQQRKTGAINACKRVHKRDSVARRLMPTLRNNFSNSLLSTYRSTACVCIWAPVSV